ncbi:MAG: glutaredoxin 3 [Myxococcales bacterium]|nr:glutaredoxin 3 [Myxococcales bacterium]
MPEIIVYSKGWCPYCDMAKRLLTQKGQDWTEIDVETEYARLEEMVERSGGRRSVPQIFIGGEHVGGFDDLYALDQAGRLDPLPRWSTNVNSRAGRSVPSCRVLG